MPMCMNILINKVVMKSGLKYGDRVTLIKFLKVYQFFFFIDRFIDFLTILQSAGFTEQQTKDFIIKYLTGPIPQNVLNKDYIYQARYMF